ncbi:hypothetical protein GY45DRAFT_1210385, partial [Cubamyces sp. BRFM 1775]
DSPRRAVSGDGYNLVYHAPRALRGLALVTLLIMRRLPKSPAGKNDFSECYKTGYDLKGMTRLVLLWHAIGQKHKPPVVCADIRSTGAAFNGAMNLLQWLEGVSLYCSRTMEHLDPVQYHLLLKLKEYRCRQYADQKAFSALDQHMLWEGREIVYNRWSPVHKDRQDPHMSWAAITYLGDFEGAFLEFPELWLRLHLSPGDVVFFRGKDLQHGAPSWVSGQRHLLVHFTHQGIWDNAGMTCSSSKA